MRASYAKYREQRSEHRRRKRQDDPEFRARSIAASAAYYRANRKAHIAHVRSRQVERADERAAYMTQYWRDNPEKAREYRNRRRALKRNAPGDHTAKDIERIRRLQGDRCAMPDCRKKLNGRGHVDHRHALSRGGSNGPENLQLLCGSCNSSKRAKDEIEFMQERGFLL